MTDRDVMVLMSGFFAGNDFYCQQIAGRGVDVAVGLRPLPNRLLRALRRLHFLMRAPGQAIWFNHEWRRMAGSKRLIIIHAADIVLPIARYLKRKAPDARVVLWYWNPVARGTNPNFARPLGAELWSFDEADSKQFGMRANTTYSFREISSMAPHVEPTVDFLFFGTDKGRAPALHELAELLESQGLSHLFCIAGTQQGSLAAYDKLVPAESVPYEKILEMTVRARVVVDIVQEGQSGLTLRALEALYLGRKLMTNSKSIRESPLYSEDRVFILGDRSPSEIRSFLNTGTVPYPPEILEYYDFDSWLKRFG